MRIISGKYRSLVLAEFKGESIRPTADRVKESLFNIISYRVENARVLDLFCGSGGLGLECLSRRAERVYFNDVSPESLSVLKKNLARMKGVQNYTIYNYDYAQCLNILRGEFNLIFIDPPYSSGAGSEALKIISARNLLAPDGIAVYERDRAFSGDCGLELYDERKYGKTYLSFFRVKQ